MRAVSIPEPYGQCEYARINVSSWESEETMNPFQAMYDIYHGFKVVLDCWSGLNYKTTFLSDFQSVGYIPRKDWEILATMTLAWVFVRYALNFFVFVVSQEHLFLVAHYI